ncbi:MAG: hypothetical protein ACREPI_00415 [Candidatus Dormibacterales bacterium]
MVEGWPGEFGTIDPQWDLAVECRPEQRSDQGGVAVIVGSASLLAAPDRLCELVIADPAGRVLGIATTLIAFCNMATLYLRNVPEDVVARLQRLATRAGTSVNAMAVRELAEASKRADNAALLQDLPDLGVPAEAIVADLEMSRSRR